MRLEPWNHGRSSPLNGVQAGIPAGHRQLVLNVVEPCRTQEHRDGRESHLRGGGGGQMLTGTSLSVNRC